MPEFRFILPHHMTEIDKLELVKLVSADYDKRNGADLIDAALKGLVQFFRIEGDMKGLIATQTLVTKQGRTLLLIGISTKGLKNNPEGFFSSLIELAKSAQCKWLSTTTKRPGVLRLAKRVNFPLAAYVLLKEI